MTYPFLSIKSKPLARIFSAGLVLMVMIYFFFRIPLWVVPSVVALLLVIYLFTRIGFVSVKRSGDHVGIQLKDISRSVSLRAPFQYQRWWSYMFESTDNDAISMFGTSGNDLNVFLKLKDASNNEVVFTEYIGYDTRFPNECTHAEETIPQGQTVFRVQRVDKLFEFLEKNLGHQDFIKSSPQ